MEAALVIPDMTVSLTGLVQDRPGSSTSKDTSAFKNGDVLYPPFIAKDFYSQLLKMNVLKAETPSILNDNYYSSNESSEYEDIKIGSSIPNAYSIQFYNKTPRQNEETQHSVNGESSTRRKNYRYSPTIPHSFGGISLKAEDVYKDAENNCSGPLSPTQNNNNSGMIQVTTSVFLPQRSSKGLHISKRGTEKIENCNRKNHSDEPEDLTRKKKNSAAIALEDLPVGSFSSDIDISTQLVADMKNNHSKVGLSLNGLGLVECKGSLMRWARLAEDVHSINTLVCLGSSPGSALLRIIRPVQKYQPIYYWFSQDIIALLDIPFLKPLNIRGEKCYECDKCGSKFENPNPLKIHIWDNCRTQTSPEDLWNQLHNSSQSKANDNKTFQFTLSSSAFRPYHRLVEDKNTCSGSEAHEVRTCSTEGFKSMTSSHKTDLLGNQPYSRIENLVANMGGSTNKQGHLCIYCGKIYSRKYGLKIHIRTHTGFKPLKCKYCLRPFGDPSNLNKHVRLHVQAQTPYRCELCNKVLVRRRDLERHIRSRHQAELNL